MATRQASRSSAGVLAAIATAAAGVVLALLTGLGQGIASGSVAETVSTSSIDTAPNESVVTIG